MRRFKAILWILMALTLAGCSGQSMTLLTAVPTASPVQLGNSGHGLQQQALQATAQNPTATAVPVPSSTPIPETDAHADVIVWWPASLMPPQESPANVELQAQIDGFTEDQGISLIVRPKRVDGVGGIMSTLRTANAVAPAALPDLVLLSRESLRAAAETGLILNMGEVLPSEVTNEVFAQAQALGEIKGQLFGAAYALNLHHMVYRETIFEVAPETFEEILAEGHPFIFAAGRENGVNDVLLIQYLEAGGYLNAEDGKPALDESVLADVLTFYESAMKNGLVGPEALDYQQPVSYAEKFLSGNIGLAHADTHSYLASFGQVPNTGIGPVSTMGGKALTTLNGWLWVLTTADPDRQADAMKFLDWMMRVEHQAALTNALGLLPSQLPALQLSLDTDYAALAALLLAADQPIITTEVSATTANALQAALASVLRNEKSAAEAAADAVASLQ